MIALFQKTKSAESRSDALGATKIKVNGFDGKYILRAFGYNDKHYSHSRQFRSNIVDEKSYWKKVRDEMLLPFIKPKHQSK